MDDQLKSFAESAKSLARNPLGIIALFIVLVYGFAALVTGFSGSFTTQERLPLIYFLIVFPVLVLGVFTWLVSNHSGKLFAPSDFENDDNFLKAVGALATASSKSAGQSSKDDIAKIIGSVREVGTNRNVAIETWRNRILWVDDRPDNNLYERKAFEAMGLRFTIALSTDEAFKRLAYTKYAAIISDMGRREGPREGYVLLDRLRAQGDQTPLFFYASSNSPEHKLETYEHGGQGCTNNGQELFEMVMKSVISSQQN